MKDSSFDFSQLSPVKQQLLQKLLQEKLASQSVPPAQVIQHTAEQEDAPLSFAQQRLWFLDQLGASNSPYHMPVASRLKGSLHLQVLEKSVQEIVCRHSVLRTIFVNQDDYPVQVVRSSIDFIMLVIDLTSLPAFVREHKISQLMSSEAQQPFDLAHGPLLRVTLLRLQNDEYILQVTFHHIIADGWSLGVFTDELSKFYTAFVGVGLTGYQGRREAPTAHPCPPDPYGWVPSRPYDDEGGWATGTYGGAVGVGGTADVGRGQTCGARHTGYSADPGSPSTPSLHGIVPDLPIQYADFARWQRAWLQGEVLQKQLDYWRQQLAGVPGRGQEEAGRGQAPSLQLPTDRPRPAVQTFAGARQSRLLAPALLQQLRKLSQQEHVTLFMTLLAAFQILLMRYSGMSDIVVGTPVANRRRGEFESLIGLFVNMLVLRTDLSGNPTFQQLLQRVQTMVLQAYDHQDMPFEKLVEDLQPERHLSYQPLFQVGFILQNFPTPGLELPKLAWRPIEVEQATSQFDLSLFLSEEEQGLLARLEYSTDLFNATTMERLLGHWQVLLEAIVCDPGQQIETLPLLTEEEREQLLVQWNAAREASPQAKTDFLGNLCLHQLFERQVEHVPEAIAVVFEDASLTYRELNCLANRLAHHLLGVAEVGPDVLVGIYMERSLEPVIALLAVLKAGGAYVPLDPQLPQERFIFLLADAQIPVVLTQAHLRDGLPPLACKTISVARGRPVAQGAGSVQDIGSESRTGSTQGTIPTVPQVEPENLAYVIYTSGSTGHPKGVQVTHANVSRLFMATADKFHFQPSDVWTMFHSFAFDFSVWEIWGALLSGGRLVVVPYWLSRSPDAFWQELMRQQVTILSQTPSAFKQLMQVQDEHYWGRRDCALRLSDLRAVIFGGEALALASLEPWVQRYGDEVPQLINMYGITETTVHVTYHRLYEEEIRGRAVGTVPCASPIGQPLVDLELYVLDRRQQLVPIGVTGEVYVGGAGLARGYLKRPDLTAERFVPHPFVGAVPCACPQPGARLYRTGDLARYRETGELEYLGRVDRQVKLRGFRIELGEIEATLRAYPGLQDAVVMLREENDARKVLVAYVVPTASPLEAHVRESLVPERELREATVGAGLAPALQEYLREQLPDYMIPARVVFLETIPLTPNGKVDRNALPTISERRESTFVAPRSETERTLATIWQQVLRVRTRVSIHDNFFALGGDSILSMQIIARARQAGLGKLTPKQLFQHQTIAQLATVVEPVEPVGSRTGASPVPMAPDRWQQEAEASGPVPLTPIQRWFFEQDLPQPQHFNQALMLQVPSNWQLQHLQQVVDGWLMRHDALRLRYERTGADWHQWLVSVEEAGSVPVEHSDLTRIAPDEQASAIEEIANRVQASLHLKLGPLLRVVLFELRHGQPARLLIVIHHLAIDGVSWRVLLEDLQQAMKGVSSFTTLCTDEPIALPARTAPFQSWAEHVQTLGQSVLQKDRTYWLKAAQIATISLPLDFPEGNNKQASARTVSMALTREETCLLLRDALRPYHSHVQELLLVALLQTLAHWVGGQQIRLDLEGHGREALVADTPDVSCTVGWFTSLYSVLFTLPHDALSLEEKLFERSGSAQGPLPAPPLPRSLPIPQIPSIPFYDGEEELPREEARRVRRDRGGGRGVEGVLHRSRWGCNDPSCWGERPHDDEAEPLDRHCSLCALRHRSAQPQWIKTIKEQLRSVPHKGISYGLLRYCSHRAGTSPAPTSPDGDLELREQFASATPSQVSFNYLGQFDQVLLSSSSKEETLQPIGLLSSAATSGPENPRSHLLDVNALIVGGQLHLQWTYSEQLHRQATIEALAQEFMQRLRDLLAHCLEPSAGGWTPSDFPLAHLDQANLDRLLVGLSHRSEAVGTGLAPVLDPTSPDGIEDLYPLTPLQQGLLFHTLYAPQSGVYVEQVSCTLCGELFSVPSSGSRKDIDSRRLPTGKGYTPNPNESSGNALEMESFERAWQQVIRRHAILRTALVWDELDEPLQVVYRHVTMPLSILDWRNREPSLQQSDLEAFLLTDRMQGFDLGQAPWMRLTLVQLSEARIQMIWTHHHLMLDGWSLSLVLQEVLACYEAEMQGRSLVHEECRPYRDYISWLAEQEGGAAEEYWRQTLAGIASPTPLGIDRKREQEIAIFQEHQSEQVYAEELLLVSAEETASWQEYTRQQHLTLNTLVQGAWALILSRYSGQTDVVFGNVVAGRPPELTGVERMVGLFINTVPVRVQVHAEEEVGTWLLRLQEQQMEQRSHEHSSLVQVQGWCEMPREHALFESLLVFENYPVQAVLAERSVVGDHRDSALRLSGDRRDSALRLSGSRRGSALRLSGVRVVEQTNYPLTIFVVPGADRSGDPRDPLRSPQPLHLRVSYDRQRFERAAIERLLGHLQRCLQQLVANPRQRLAEVSLLTEAERELVACGWGQAPTLQAPPLKGRYLELSRRGRGSGVERRGSLTDPASPSTPPGQKDFQIPTPERQAPQEWNATETLFPIALCVHQLFERQVEQTPDSVALAFGGDEVLTYTELNRRANQLARHLRGLGVGPEVLVGICLERSIEMVVGLLAVLKAGGAYVPLDPAYPAERQAWILADAQPAVVLTQQCFLAHLPDRGQLTICFDQLWETLAAESLTDLVNTTQVGHTAYVIYTSGSTGTPKGVMISHQNVVNFFRGMDEHFGRTAPGVWMAVTSISFDISVLELFWTLTRGFQVVLYVQPHTVSSSVEARLVPPAHSRIEKELAFSLFYFASDVAAADGYRLLLEGAKFADKHGFQALWTPERHFHEFGGLYPNPSVTGAAVAAVTKRIQIRAGSVVLPLHNPIRVAEEWAVVDNLSRGRVGIAFASGWHANDFVFAPDKYAPRKEVMRQDIETVRKLWRGETIMVQGGTGDLIAVKALPRPVQAELPVWITSAGSVETFRLAGDAGAYVLTHLLGQDLQQLAAKIAVYREAWHRHGHDTQGQTGHVTLMIHTFIGTDLETVRATVRQPFRTYLRSSVDLLQRLAQSQGLDINANTFHEDDMQVLLDHAFERYFASSGLMGTVDSCLPMIENLKAIGVDELACLIDFGVVADEVLDGLQHLEALKEYSKPVDISVERDTSLSAQLLEYGISHLQCTPSLMNMLLMEPLAALALQGLSHILLGGEQLPLSLVKQIHGQAQGTVPTVAAKIHGQAQGTVPTVAAKLHNMYGPTETTIWSTTTVIEPDAEEISLGSPIVNTQIYLLDAYLQPVPIGVAGEIYIGGAGLARGYLNKADLTAERFLPDPWDKHGGGRLYRTGDVARYHEDGTLEALGRRDQQVKLRGYRIELGEIEAVLRAHPAIHEAVVLLHEEEQGLPLPAGKVLVAYVVVQGEERPTYEDLHAHLYRQLPQYMIPASIVFLEKLPLTPNGKIDRKVLLVLERGRRDGAGRRPLPYSQLHEAVATETPLEPPQTPLQEQLATIWLELLHLPQVSIHSNFFALGGHSLLAAQLMVHIHTTFKVKVPLRSLFEAPTIAEMAAIIERMQREITKQKDNTKVAISKRLRDTNPIPLSFAQERLWFLDQLAPNSAWYVVSQAFHISGPLQMEALERSLAMVVQRHEVLRTTFSLQEGRPVQIIASDPAGLQVPVIDLRGLTAGERDQQVRQLARADAQRPFDLTVGPLLRVQMLRLSARQEGSLDPHQDRCKTPSPHDLPPDPYEPAVSPALGSSPVSTQNSISGIGRDRGRGGVRRGPCADPDLSNRFSFGEREMLQMVVGQAQESGAVGTQMVPPAPQEHVLLFALHHIISDGRWSMSILVRELSALYQAALFSVPSSGSRKDIDSHRLPGGKVYIPNPHESSGSALEKKPSPLPALPFQYADYAIWQRQQFQDEVLEGQLAYWQQQLSGAPSSLQLPTDRLRPAVQTYAGSKLALYLSSTLLQALSDVSQREGVTLFMTLLAAFQVLLMRYSGQSDIVVGTPITDRGQAGLENLIGFFVNTLVLRSDLSGNPSFRQLLARVREVALEAYAHQDLPFEKLVESLQVERSLSHTPLFQVLFVMQNAASFTSKLADLTFRQIETEHFTTRFDLSLIVTPGEGGLLTEVEYSTDLFDAATITRLLSHWQVLLEEIVRDPEQPIEVLPLLTQAEREQILVQWNATAVGTRRDTDDRKGSSLRPLSAWACPPPQDLCLHQIFERQVEQTPEAVAVVFENQQLTYQQLNGQANQLAYRLRKVGIGPDEVVGVCMERSLELVIALLAVLKAGGAYVPLDPSYPQERLHFLLEDTRVSVVLTQAHLSGVGIWKSFCPGGVDGLPGSVKDPHLSTLPPRPLRDNPKYLPLRAQAYRGKPDGHGDRFSLSTVEIICLTSGDLRSSEDNLACPVQPDNLAYMIYTSGSTGKPKGVMNTHRGICNRLGWMQQTYHLTTKDRVLQKTPFSFDVSVWEFFWPLTTGACLIVASPGGHQDPTYLQALIAEESVTTLHFVPSMLQAFLAEQHLQSCSSLRQVISSGEALTASLQAHFFAHAPQEVQLHNLYGPTEAAIDVTYWSCLRDRRDSALRLSDGYGVPIGRPIANIQIYLLDGNFQPVPIGVTGELYIGGVGLARGYAEQPDLTAERFIPNPFVGTMPCACPEPGTRLYRTGDLARYRADGAIEYIGRIDQQVKIRGFRIELGEIETVLLKHPDVREAVVLAWEDAPGDKRLAAYIVAEGSKQLSAGNLRQYLLDRLPDYMIPAIFMLLEELPRTPNGKLDRAALPAPDWVRIERDEAPVSARTPTEEVLSAIWASVLSVGDGSAPQVGIHDNFFALGGDSIRSIQVLSQARERGIHFSLQQLFREQTIYGLVRVLGAESLEGLLAEPVQAFSLISPQAVWGNIAQISPSAHLGQPQGIAPTMEEGLACDAFPADVEDAYPLTRLQEGMVFHSQHHPAVYHDIFSFHLAVPYHLQLLQIALEKLAACHPILRTSFHLSNLHEPLQLVHHSVTIPLQVQDLSMLSPIEQEERLGVWLEEEKHRPFVWTQPPLLRFQIHLRSETTLQLTLSFHHAVLDGWSAASLLSELMKTYLSLLSGDNTSFLPQPRMQFRDFVAWEEKVIANQEAKQYWQKILREVTSVRLPRWTKVQQESTEVYVLPVPISSETGTRLKSLAQKLAVPLKSVLLAAHLRVLSLLHGQTDVLTGLVSNARPEIADGERTLGLFLNTLPFRLHLSGGTWSELIAETFTAECELLPYRWYPLSEIQKQSGIRAPFETLFNFVHFHVYQNLLAVGKAVSPVPFQVLGSNVFEKTNFTLVATFSQDLMAADVIHLSLQCDTKELCLEQIKAIGDYYARMLVELSREPDGRYEWQTLLSVQEREQLLGQWNATQVDYLQDCCIHQLIERQVEQTPDSVALVFEEQQLTYQQLNGQANQIAHHLLERGIGPEVLVGVYMERSLELVVALLAILKAGGAYVPLDPQLPQERLNFLLEDARLPVVLAQAHLRDRFLPSNVKLICVAPSHLEFRDNPTSLVQPDNLAYMMYTSGSTGRPKAVMITHRNAATMIQWACHFFAKRDLAGVLASTSISFDLSVFELFVPLSAGGTVVLAENLLQLPAMLAASRVTLVNTVPSVLGELLRMSSLPTPVQTVNLAGEPVPYSLVQQLYQQATIQQVFNLYGPSEDTTYSTVAAIGQSSVGTGASPVPTAPVRVPMAPVREPIPIGRPIANTQTYLLDKHLMPVPIGATGTLYLGGEGLARGYAGRPELTAERFVPNPFVGTGLAPVRAGARLYHTGDLARYLPDGSIEYLGRVDQQIKLRGFRIELGEIETTLMSHPVIQECAVLVQEDPSGEKRLVAYLVVLQGQPMELVGAGSAQGTIPTAPALRSYLQDRLPIYMIPATFVLLDALPRTSNGKVDRRVLASKTLPMGLDNRTMVAPRTHVEKALAAIWRDLLHLEQVSITDNFFAVGGHSLLAVRLLNRINQQFGETQLSLTTLLQVPTIEQIAALVQKEVRSLSTSALVTIQPVAQAYRLEEKRPFFCVHDGTGGVYGLLDLAKHLHHDRPFYGIQAPGLSVDHVLFDSIEEMATAYIDEIFAVQPMGPYFVGGYSFGGLVAFEMARQLQAQGHAIALLALLDSYPREPDASTSVERAGTSPAPTEMVKDYAAPMLSMVKELGHYWKKQVSLSYEELCHLQPDEQLSYLLDRLREAQVVPDDMDVLQLRRYIQVHEAHGSCLRRYRPKPYAGRITLLRSEDGAHDPSFWTPFSAEPVEVHTVAGDHVSMVVEPYVTTLAVQLQQCLDKADDAGAMRGR
jgi:natural product biosynthesis luciferase-like monooxygenase protein/amino acid adenylation domain-containing protein/non-ribosomal peptide synthase protein (TIGR01720 family)